jgi:hypothetical protein
MSRTNLMSRDLQDVVAQIPHNMRVLDVQETHTAALLEPSSWDTAVFLNDHGTRLVVRQHRHTGATRIKAIPAKTVDLLQPEAYELELLPDVPFRVLTDLMEILR